MKTLMLVSATVLLLVACGGDRPVSPDAVPDRPAGPDDHALVSGWVVEAGGAPVAGVAVQPEPLGGSAPVPDLAVVTDGEGRFQWRLPPGRYRLTAATGNRRSAPVEVTLIAAQRTTVTLRLDRS